MIDSPRAQRVLFFFLDGVGLGSDDPSLNPLVGAHLPTLNRLLNNQPLTASTGRLSTQYADFIPTNATLGVPSRPQSATGQATLLTGTNVAARLGEHFGPRPDDRVRAVLHEGNLFQMVADCGYSAFYSNAYPSIYFHTLQRGKRLLGAIAYAAQRSGLKLMHTNDLRAGRVVSSDYTCEEYCRELNCYDVPILSARAAGKRISAIAEHHHFTFHEHWFTDLCGHRMQLDHGRRLIERFDRVLGSVLSVTNLDETLIVITSDHGNLEACDRRQHTTNCVPTLLIGRNHRRLAERVHSLVDIAPVVTEALGLPADALHRSAQHAL